MKTRIDIRLYQPADEPRLRALAAQNYRQMQPGADDVPPSSPHEKRYVDHLLHSVPGERSWLFVAERADELVGMVCLAAVPGGQAPDDAQAAYGFMSDLFVAATHRRQGIGRALAAHAEAHARERGLARLALRVMADSRPARQFYAAAGYREAFVVLSKALARP